MTVGSVVAMGSVYGTRAGGPTFCCTGAVNGTHGTGGRAVSRAQANPVASLPSDLPANSTLLSPGHRSNFSVFSRVAGPVVTPLLGYHAWFRTGMASDI